MYLEKYVGVVYGLITIQTVTIWWCLSYLIIVWLYEEILELVKQLVFPKLDSNFMPGTPWHCHNVLPLVHLSPSLYLVNFLLWDTLSAAHTISPCSNHPERYSMNNGGLVPSSNPSQQTQETIFYDTPMMKEQSVSTKYDSFGNHPLCQSTLIVAT